MVVGTDGSETAERAVRQAAQMASTTGARLIVVTAYEPQGDKLVDEEPLAPDELRWMLTDRSQAEERARRGRSIANEAGAEGVVVQAIEGQPAEVILTCARDFNADLIVVGSKGLTSPVHFVLGSVASSVGHHAPCDVLIVHTELSAFPGHAGRR